MQFDFQDIEATYWFNNSILTTFITALSASFPPGEQHFIDSVRYYRGEIEEPTLQSQISGFIGQEGHHRKQHMLANKKLDELGLHASRIEQHIEKDLNKFLRKLSPQKQLASTVCMEHITAILAEHTLTVRFHGSPYTRFGDVACC